MTITAIYVIIYSDSGKEVCGLIAYAALIDDHDDLLTYTDLVEKYQEEMYRIAKSVLHDHQLAEDAVQNALYGAAVSFKHVPKEDDAAHTYLLSCAKYAALRIHHAQQKTVVMEQPELLEFYPENDPTFEAIQHSDAYDQLLHAIEQLDDIYQDALLHFYVFDQSVKEIAKLFGCKPSTIRKRLSRGRKLLAEICRREGIIRD